MIGREPHINPARGDVSRVPPGTWIIDPAGSEVTFRVRHLGFHEVKGNLRSFGGTIVTDEDESRSSATALVDLSSLDTGSSSRDKHLTSNGLLYNDNQQEARYESLAVHTARDALVVDGSLSLFSKSRPVSFAVRVDLITADSLAFTAQTEFSRRELDLRLHVTPSFFDRAVSDKVTVSMRIVARRAPAGMNAPELFR